MHTLTQAPIGQLARQIGGSRLPLQVLRSAAGYYLGTADEAGPVSRESAEYWPTQAEAHRALTTGPHAWTQRDHV
jgi:hypothetical protein